MATTIEDRLILGDVSALEDMYSRHGALVHSIAAVVEPDSRDRVTASVFTVAWEEHRQFDPSRGSVQAWLVRILRGIYPMDPDSDRRVDELVIAGTVASMDESQRQILVEGSAAEGQTEDLAERLDLPVGTVESYLRRGVKRLQSELVDSRQDGDDSRLAAIIRSGRLEADFARPPEDVWDQIAGATGLVDTSEPPVGDDATTVPPPSPPAPQDMRATDPVEDLEWDELNADSEEDLGDHLPVGESGLGLVDEFSTTEFPGQQPIQPDFASLEADRRGGLDSEVAGEDLDVDTKDRPEDDANNPAVSKVPYVLSGQYRPGVDADPYAEQSSLGEPAIDDPGVASDPISEEDGSVVSTGSEIQGQRPDRVKDAEATYFADDGGSADSGSQVTAWARIAIVVLAALVLVFIVMSLR